MTKSVASFGKLLFNVDIAISAMLGILLALTLAIIQPAEAQTFSVLHYFTGGADGANPYAGLTVGGTGTLYGTASAGGTNCTGTAGCGLVFKLAQRNGSWNFTPLYEFIGQSDGANPSAGVVIGPNGALYGTTQNGGNGGGSGTVFKLTPPLSVCKAVLCYWNVSVLHAFAGPPGASQPGGGNLLFDHAGDIYDTTVHGGAYDYGAVYELTAAGGGWTESILYSFEGSPNDGEFPGGGLIFDAAGNLYGTTTNGGNPQTCPGGCGTVFKLSPGGNWTETILHYNDLGGYWPYSTLVLDQQGNLYGTNWLEVFEFTSQGENFLALNQNCFQTYAGLTIDEAANLYGVCTTGNGSYSQYGLVFKLTYSNGTWAWTDLHDFTGSDGANPTGPVALDSSGNLYGTTYRGGTSGFCFGTQGCGVIWEIAGVGAHN